MAQADSELEYVGFWLRVGASLVDTVLLVAATAPLLWLLYGRAFDPTSTDLTAPGNFLFDWVLPAVAIVAFWIARQATPGKMLISARIVDARTGAKPTLAQAIVRYLGYFVSTVPLGLGLIWVGLDPRKQGWHDKLAGTVVVRPRRRSAAPVRFTAD